MERTKIILTGLWTALMFTYLLGDVLRVYSGDVKPGELFGQKASQIMYLGIAAFMFIPILMIILNLLLSGNILRWLNLIVTLLLFIINLIGVPSYKSWYDAFLIILSLVINVLIFWQAYVWSLS
ncbi:MAG: hypothetical protein GX217_05100 [Clostridiaceae bacterium]|nr:hypothetical protein [Clostridiaceae bacterium]